ncbi:hypothetical protein BDV12DRAFT_187434 [Aspergillus spectabilis]
MAINNLTVPGTPSNTSSGGEFDGEDFSNTLFTILAPLLTLFGEQMGFGDDILLAMAPLVILTSVVTAIRVGGRRWLNALVGRAREIRPTAELELLSCTRDAVLRERGTSRTKEFIYRNIDADIPGFEPHNLIFDHETTCQQRIMTAGQFFSKVSGTSAVNLSAEYAARAMTDAPNLTLNISNATTSSVATWYNATLGAVVQTSVLGVAGFVTYHWQVPAQGSTIVRYGFPPIVIGTVLLCGEIFLCPYVVETHTEEVDFKPRPCTVGDQRYGSYAIMNEEGNKTLRTSRIYETPSLSCYLS